MEKITREELDRVRENAVLMGYIAEKIARLERIIKDRGESFARTKEMQDLKLSYKILDENELRQRAVRVIQDNALSPFHKTVLYDYYIIGKTAKAIAADTFRHERGIYHQLRKARIKLGIQGKCQTNHS